MGGHACEKCGKSFGSEQALEQHMADYDHSKLGACQDCGETFLIRGADTGRSVRLVGPQPLSRFRNAIQQVS